MIPQDPLGHEVDNTLDVSIDLYPAYDWEGRTIKLHRADIRTFLGFREATVQDFNQMTAALLATDLPNDHTIEHLKAIVYARFRALRIEPPNARSSRTAGALGLAYLRAAVLRHHICPARP